MLRHFRILTLCMLAALFCLAPAQWVLAQDKDDADDLPISDATSQCLACHEGLHPGIVEGWRKSRHGRITPAEGLKKDEQARRVSSTDIPEELQETVVGCAECHTMRADKHADTFDHAGFKVHVVVSPDDCATCHSTEREEFKDNLMSQAYGNLVNNPFYQKFVVSVNGHMVRNDAGEAEFTPSDQETYAESCLYCHGTKLSVNGTKTHDTDYGSFDVPVIEGWPNQGPGRINLDGSKGSCTPCHTRHTFSIAEARSPSTCGECHSGPDVPAYKVYDLSKHGTIYDSKHADWDFDAVPWTVGKDFRAPTCATCHISEVVSPDGTVIAKRTHAVTPRLPWRIFGLIYAHPQPIKPDTSIIVNQNGIHLPTTLDGDIAMDFLIDAKERAARTKNMQAVCRSCHGASWVEQHWARFENTIKVTNERTLVTTKLMREAWKDGLATGMDKDANPFDEYPERLWTGVWFFAANHVRYASAMAGGGDYGVFERGRYNVSERFIELNDWVNNQKKMGGGKDEKKK